MGQSKLQRTSAVWRIAGRQHDVISRNQLLGLGFSRDAIQHRVAKGRLHPLWPGVYAVGRPRVTRLGRWMGAVLACGPDAVLSHESAAALWRIRAEEQPRTHISVPSPCLRRRHGVLAHRRSNLAPHELTKRQDVPVTAPATTLLDLAARVSPADLEAAINAADKHGLISPESLRAAIEGTPRRPGLAVLRRLLDRQTFVLTESELERLFLAIARDVGLSRPQTGCKLNGFKVDFYWPDLRLVVETDGLRYHRTPGQQAKDRRRDQAHTAAGLRPLRFTHAQVCFEANHVRTVLRRVAGHPRADRFAEASYGQ